MTNQEKLTHLNNLVLDKMIQFIENDETERLADLATPSNYLAKNNMVEEKKRSSVEEEIKARLKQAEERRNSARKSNI